MGAKVGQAGERYTCLYSKLFLCRLDYLPVWLTQGKERFWNVPDDKRASVWQSTMCGSRTTIHPENPPHSQ
eukprot:6989053-Pyramimonas_sp.AAC.1